MLKMKRNQMRKILFFIIVIFLIGKYISNA